jgi:hypothetical protein
LGDLDGERLARFAAEEPVYSRAIQAAWMLLAQRVLDETVKAEQIRPVSAHLDPAVAAACVRRLRSLRALAAALCSPSPERLLSRLHCAEVFHDPWATQAIQRKAVKVIDQTERTAADWLDSLPPLSPIDHTQRPVVVVVDALPADVFLAGSQALEHSAPEGEFQWFRLSADPSTVPALAELLGVSAGQDPIEALTARGIRYYRLEGNESHPLTEIMEPLDPHATVVVRLGIIDSSIHGRGARLCDLPDLFSSLIATHMPALLALCKAQARPCVLTTDHGLTFTKGTLSHGRGGVFERAIGRVLWG